MLAQTENRCSGNYDFSVTRRFARFTGTLIAKRGMIHESFSETIKLRKRAKPAIPRRRLIGGREILLVLIAFALLAVVPSVAQISPFRRDNQTPPTAKMKWDAEYPAETFPGSAFFYLDQNYSIPPGSVDSGAGDIDALVSDNPTGDFNECLYIEKNARKRVCWL